MLDSKSSQSNNIKVMASKLLYVLRGAIGQNVFVESFASASTTYVAAISNLSSAVTYILSPIFRIEAFNLDTWRGRARVAGTFIDISGAMVVTFYRGLSIHIGSTSVDLLQHPRITPLPEVYKLILGAVFAFSNSICFSLFLIILVCVNLSCNKILF